MNSKLNLEAIKQRKGNITSTEEEKILAEKVGRVLMIFPTPVRRQTMLNTLPPLGILSIASVLEAKGIPTDVVDCHVTREMPDFKDYGVICFSVNIANVQNTAQYIKEIRAEGLKPKIIIGGPQSPSRAEYWIKEYHVDGVFIGEAENSIYEYLLSENPTSVKGVVIEKDGKPFYTGPRPVIMNIDDLPFPALDKVPIRNYNTPIKKAYPVSSIITSRGCPGQCTFCNSRGGIWRQRSAANVVDEIEWQVNKLGVRELWIADDNFTLNRQRAWDIAEDIIKRGIKVKMQCKNGIRVDKVDKELLLKLKEAGMWLVAVAPETGKQETLDRICKGFTLERVREVVKWCKEIKMQTFSLFIIGLPWETLDDIGQTIKFAMELDTDFVQYSRYTPIEGTPLYEEVKSGGMLLENEYQDVGIHSGTLNYVPKLIDREEMRKVFKQAFRRFYLRPSKIINILKTLTPKDIYYNVKYSIEAGSM
ncbi:MAG: radical SAM protein [Candidatus Woesearchaeota archaeon]